MILAVQRAKEEYEARFPGRSFEDMVGEAVRRGGYVALFPELCIVAFPVSNAGGRWLHDDQNPEAWYVTCAATAGSDTFWDHLSPGQMLAGFLRLAPRRLPSVVWARRGGRERVYPVSRLERMVNRSYMLPTVYEP